jgi:sugar lactone lactonase YvrE
MKLRNTYAIAAVIGFMCLRATAQVTVSTLPITLTDFPQQVQEPYNVVEDSSGNMFISDSVNNRIIEVNATNGAATVLAGSSTGAQLFDPQGLLVVSINGSTGLLVAESGDNLIRFVNFTNGAVTTLAGQNLVKNGVTNELGANATFNYPLGMDQDANGNVYIADSKQHAIRVINLRDPLLGVTNLLCTDGTSFGTPTAVAFVGANQLWVADSGNNSVKLITLATPTTGSLTTYIGGAAGNANSSIGTRASFEKPSGLLWIPGVGLIISDTGNNSLRLATYAPAYGVNNYAVGAYPPPPRPPRSMRQLAWVSTHITALFWWPIGATIAFSASSIRRPCRMYPQGSRLRHSMAQRR